MSITEGQNELAEEVKEIRKRLQAIHAESGTPVVSHAAYQADIYCHRILWEIGAEDASSPALTERSDEDA